MSDENAYINKANLVTGSRDIMGEETKKRFQTVEQAAGFPHGVVKALYHCFIDAPVAQGIERRFPKIGHRDGKLRDECDLIRKTSSWRSS
jgi:hypothetical protein